MPKMPEWTRYGYTFDTLVVLVSELTSNQFQFLGLVTYGIATATKFCGLQAAHSHLKDEIDKLRLEKTENENEVLALTSRIALLEEAEIRHKRREPEVRHYLEQFALMKR